MSTQDQTTQNQTVDDDRDERLATHDLLDTASADGTLSKFVGSVSAAGLEALLRGPDLVTVFVPVNEAFGEDPAPTAQSMDLGKTADMIRRHIVRGALTAAELTQSQTLNTLQGVPVRVMVDGAGLRVGGARVLRSDIECTNGVIHVMDSLLAG